MNKIEMKTLLELIEANDIKGLNLIDWRSAIYNGYLFKTEALRPFYLEPQSDDSINYYGSTTGSEKIRQFFNDHRSELLFNFSSIHVNSGYDSYIWLTCSDAWLTNIEAHLSAVEVAKTISLEPAVSNPEVLNLDNIRTVDDWNAINWTKFLVDPNAPDSTYQSYPTKNVLGFEGYPTWERLRALTSTSDSDVGVGYQYDYFNIFFNDRGLTRYRNLSDDICTCYICLAEREEAATTIDLDPPVVVEATPTVSQELPETAQTILAITPAEPPHTAFNDPFIVLWNEDGNSRDKSWSFPEYGLPSTKIGYWSNEYNMFASYDEAKQVVDKILEVAEEDIDVDESVNCIVAIAQLIGVYSSGDLPRVKRPLISHVATYTTTVANDNNAAQSLAA